MIIIRCSETLLCLMNNFWCVAFHFCSVFHYYADFTECAVILISQRLIFRSRTIWLLFESVNSLRSSFLLMSKPCLLLLVCLSRTVEAEWVHKNTVSTVFLSMSRTFVLYIF